MGYLDFYKKFVNTPKTFIVEFYKEYEGNGGYWNCYDEWVSGPFVHDTILRETFSSIEDSLKYIDDIQDQILKIEQKRCGDKIVVKWLDSLGNSFIDFCPDNHELMFAKINWNGSSFKMRFSYEYNEKEN